jgi:hypothetical protein
MGCHYKGIVVCVSAVTKSLYNTVALPPERLKFIILVTYAYLYSRMLFLLGKY